MAYKTQQSKSVRDFFLKHKNTIITADKLVLYLERKGIAISRATVYRHLKTLCEEGFINRIELLDNSHGYRYSDKQKKNRNVLLLKCSQCNMVMKKRYAPLREMAIEIEDLTGFRVSRDEIVLTGLCNKCKRKKN
jgi:Fur family peroxide stress response transcriptional regulator